MEQVGQRQRPAGTGLNHQRWGLEARVREPGLGCGGAVLFVDGQYLQRHVQDPQDGRLCVVARRRLLRRVRSARRSFPSPRAALGSPPAPLAVACRAGTATCCTSGPRRTLPRPWPRSRRGRPRRAGSIRRETTPLSWSRPRRGSPSLGPTELHLGARRTPTARARRCRAMASPRSIRSYSSPRPSPRRAVRPRCFPDVCTPFPVPDHQTYIFERGAIVFCV